MYRRRTSDGDRHQRVRDYRDGLDVVNAGADSDSHNGNGDANTD